MLSITGSDLVLYLEGTQIDFNIITVNWVILFFSISNSSFPKYIFFYMPAKVLLLEQS